MENKTLEETLIPYVEKVFEQLEKGYDFTMDQMPDLIQQFFLWHTLNHAFWLLVWASLFIIGLVWFRKASKKISEYGYKEKWEIRQLVSILGSFVGIIGSLIKIPDLIFILAAPKLYLLEYFIEII